MHGNFHFSLMKMTQNHQKSRKIMKIREITGTWGFTRVLPGSNGLTSVHRGAHWFTRVLPGAHWFTRVQNRHLVTPSAVLTTTKKGQIYAKIWKNHENDHNHGFTRVQKGSHGFKRVHTGSYGNTGTHTGAHRGSPFCVPPSAARIPTGAS